MTQEQQQPLTLTFSTGPERHTITGRLVTLPPEVQSTSGQGIEIEGVVLEYVTDEVPHGVRAFDDASKRKLDELRQRFKIMSQASVVPFDLQG